MQSVGILPHAEAGSKSRHHFRREDEKDAYLRGIMQLEAPQQGHSTEPFSQRDHPVAESFEELNSFIGIQKVSVNRCCANKESYAALSYGKYYTLREFTRR